MHNLDKYDNIGLINKINKLIKTKSKSFLDKNKQFIEKSINSDDRQKLIDLFNFIYSDEDKRVIKQTKINYENLSLTQIIDGKLFNELKFSLTNFLMDENFNNIYNTLDEQVKYELLKYPNLKLLECIYDKTFEFNEDDINKYHLYNINLMNKYKELSEYIICYFKVKLNLLSNRIEFVSYWIINYNEEIDLGMKIVKILEIDKFLHKVHDEKLIYSDILLAESRQIQINLEEYFNKFRINTIGYDTKIINPINKTPINCIYADWTASGRCYLPIENILSEKVFPYISNGHTENSSLGNIITLSYKKSRNIIKDHVNANKDDILLLSGSGMTGALYKFQSILGIKVHEKQKDILKQNIKEEDIPIVLISHYEHHSNQISWENGLCDVVIVKPDNLGKISILNFENELIKYNNRTNKFVCISSCSNVTGILSPYHEIAKLTHKYGGYCFVDFATSFGYVNIDMHPNDYESYLDAIYFSPHKLLGGPGTSGVCIFNKNLYKLIKPDFCGGGVVNWTNPWGEQSFLKDIEEREDAGTPGFIQTIKTALAIKLKEEMTVNKIKLREKEINDIFFNEVDNLPNVHIIESNQKERLSIFSIYIDNLHYNLLAKILNDYYGIQCRGGCNCAGTYGHIIFGIDMNKSKSITDSIDKGDNSLKPGWCRISFHPITTDEEIYYVCNAIKEISLNHETIAKSYEYNNSTNQFTLIESKENKWIDFTVNSIFNI